MRREDSWGGKQVSVNNNNNYHRGCNHSAMKLWNIKDPLSFLYCMNMMFFHSDIVCDLLLGFYLFKVHLTHITTGFAIDLGAVTWSDQSKVTEVTFLKPHIYRKRYSKAVKHEHRLSFDKETVSSADSSYHLPPRKIKWTHIVNILKRVIQYVPLVP